MVDAGLWLVATSLLVLGMLTYAAIRLVASVLAESAAEREAATVENGIDADAAETERSA